MSVILGFCHPEGASASEMSLLRVADSTARFGPDETRFHCRGRIGMGFQAFFTHNRSRTDTLPAEDHLGNMLVFDGRIDNYEELADQCGVDPKQVSDSTLILSAFERWGEECFSRLLGDWAIALWSANDRVLYLARDHAGTRTLFYRNLAGLITWSTHLDTFFVDAAFPELNSEYVARLLASQQTLGLTPYKGIETVPPAHYVSFHADGISMRPHWKWRADSRIVYRHEAEYDEHFLHQMRRSVIRRIIPGEEPILAELSGGVDSSFIVCLADRIVEESAGQLPEIDTVSYYDDSEPDWDERPFFTAVERQRKKKGIHIDYSLRVPSFRPLVSSNRIYPYPCMDSTASDYEARFEQSVGAGRYRVVLSGTGGDELLGGVPAPMPELADYLRAGKIGKLFSRATEWCLVHRQPLINMLRDTLIFTGDLYHPSRQDQATIPPWLGSDLRRLCLDSPTYPMGNDSPFTAWPSAISNGRTWWTLLGSLRHLRPNLSICYEYRYPYLDKELVEYLHRIPREQLLRPGRRRLLMRRAMVGIVPNEIIERKRKAYISQSPVLHLRKARHIIEHMFSCSLAASLGLIDRDAFLTCFRAELTGELKWLGAVTQTIGVELWLQSLNASDVHVRTDGERTGSIRTLPLKERATRLRATDARG